MTLDSYGRYIGRHRDWRDDPSGYAIDLDDGRHNAAARALFDDGSADDGERYDRPIALPSVSKAPLFVEPRRPLATVER